MIGLGIESSCDETSVGIVRNGKDLLSLKTYSQIPLHAIHNGIVPEIASRSHLEKINYLIDEALSEAEISLNQIGYIAVTNRPGLLGSLLIGVQTAKALGIALDIPVVPIDHLEAHFSIVRLENHIFQYPYLGLLLSGGNSAIFKVNSPDEMETICDTNDDAIGEAFDKISVLLNLGYPGGPIIEKEAFKHKREKKEVPLFPKLLKDNHEELRFSYSGIKTSVLQLTKKNTGYKSFIPKICYDFQNSVFELVERNLIKSIEKTKLKNVIAAGGVLANSNLRERLKKLANKYNFEIVYPEKKVFCTDNGAMVACQGFLIIESGKKYPDDFKISPSRESYYEIKT